MITIINTKLLLWAWKKTILVLKQVWKHLLTIISVLIS